MSAGDGDFGPWLEESRAWAERQLERFVPPEEFAQLAEAGQALGLRHVEAGPLVRSSYRAGDQARRLA